MKDTETNVDWVTEKVFAADTGLSKRALEAQRQRGQLPNGLVWIKAANGRILYSRKGWNQWVGSQRSILKEYQSMGAGSSSDSAGTKNVSDDHCLSPLLIKTLSGPLILEVK